MCMAFLAGTLVFAAETKVEATMAVARCQAILKDGMQCPYEAPKGGKFCWRHRGAVKAMNETMDDAGEGAGKAWQSTKTWSTNAWESTKRGTNKAWTSTKEAFEEAGEELGKIFTKDKKTKNGKPAK